MGVLSINRIFPAIFYFLRNFWSARLNKKNIA